MMLVNRNRNRTSSYSSSYFVFAIYLPDIITSWEFIKSVFIYIQILIVIISIQFFFVISISHFALIDTFIIFGLGWVGRYSSASRFCSRGQSKAISIYFRPAWCAIFTLTLSTSSLVRPRKLSLFLPFMSQRSFVRKMGWLYKTCGTYTRRVLLAKQAST